MELNLQEKAYRTLELDRVLQMLAAQAGSEPARERALSLRPAMTAETCEAWMEETNAASRLLGRAGTPSFSALRVVTPALTRAEMGGALNPRELLDVAAVLSTTRVVKAYRKAELDKPGQEKTAIDHLFFDLAPNKTLEERITRTVLSEEEISDTASPTLADIRRHMRQNRNRAREVLQKIISSPAYAKYLQETIITQRAERYVVPVKSEHRGDVPGLVHDVSASGATFFVEPMAVVQLGNELRELLAKEQREIERILAELSAEVAAFSESIDRNFHLLTALDLIFAKAKLSYEMRANPPRFNRDGVIVLNRARHPLVDPKVVVPINIHLGQHFDTLVITGPNTGGKTVSLKTLGLLTIMAACGLHIPAEADSTLSFFTHVLTDIGDEQSIEQSLSTFSSHIKNIIAILNEADENALVLFDELGAGTDPVEGAALAVAIIEYARRRGLRVAATTHYSELKTYALLTPGVENASCEFDVETLMPTYKLLIGVPGKSNAFAIAARLGLGDDIIEAARGHVSLDNVRFEDVLTQLERKRQDLERLEADMQGTRKTAREDAEKAAALRARMERESEQHVERARNEARLILSQARMTSDEVIEEARRISKLMAGEASAQELGAARADLRRRLNEAETKAGGTPTVEKPVAPSRPIVVGDTVRLLRLGSTAHVLSIDGDKYLLQAGILKVTVRSDEISLVEETRVKAPRPAPPGSGSNGPRMDTATPELDLRGLTVDEALLELDRFLDSALLSGLHTLTVIHGKGTGALRSAIHAALRRHPQVKSFRLGRFGEGEHGVSIVELK